jgi:hypothetical protein
VIDHVSDSERRNPSRLRPKISRLSILTAQAYSNSHCAPALLPNSSAHLLPVGEEKGNKMSTTKIATAATRQINAVVVSAGLMQKTVKVRIGVQQWNAHIRKVGSLPDFPIPIHPTLLQSQSRQPSPNPQTNVLET